MDISGMVQPSYDSRAASSAPMTRTMAAPQYIPHTPYNTAAGENMVLPHQEMPAHQHPFNFSPYPNANLNMLASGLPENYIQSRPLPRLAHPGVDERRSYTSNNQQSYVDDFHNQTPTIKPEPLWSPTAESPASRASKANNASPILPDPESAEVNFDTEVDTLMKAIQAKSQVTQAPHNSPDQPAPRVSSQPSRYVHSAEEVAPTHDTKEEPQDDPKNGKRRYQCQNCMKSFYQKTHLDIHERSHTGIKPYPCKEPGCGRSFSQLGNLRTHERRHTGERPYHCEICGKRFAQRGNVRAHRIVHEQAKPYLCRLDQCGKQFTQLGNLKSHQNKFHAQTIRDLTNKFASIKDGDVVASADKELWEYFANLYKNSNKGIKGRGKDRKVGTNPAALDSRMRSLRVTGGARWPRRESSPSYIRAWAAISNHGMKSEEQYGVYGGGDEEVSQSESRSGGGSGSSVEPYDDAPSDGYDDAGRGGDLAFGDRLY